MITESDNIIFLLERIKVDHLEKETVRAIPSAFSDEWIVITENDYGELTIERFTELELVEEFGPIPTD